MKPIWKEIGIVALILVVIGSIWGCTIKSDNTDIKDWATSNGETVKKIDFRQFSTGPYIPMKNFRYYYVETQSNVYWFKYYIGRTIIQELPNRQYKDIE